MKNKLRSIIIVLALAGQLFALSACVNDNKKATNSPTENPTTTNIVITTKAPTTSAVDPKSEKVYITNTGEKYHRASCKYLAKSKIEITLSEAKSKGYSPCSVCKPPN